MAGRRKTANTRDKQADNDLLLLQVSRAWAAGMCLAEAGAARDDFDLAGAGLLISQVALEMRDHLRAAVDDANAGS